MRERNTKNTTLDFTHPEIFSCKNSASDTGRFRSATATSAAPTTTTLELASLNSVCKDSAAMEAGKEAAFAFATRIGLVAADS